MPEVEPRKGPRTINEFSEHFESDRASGHSPPSGDVTLALRRLATQHPSALEDLVALVHSELRARADRHLTHAPPWRTLSGTELVHEVFIRLFGNDRPVALANRRHFFMAASRSMRDILVERARAATARKRGGDRDRVPLTDAIADDDPVMADAAAYLDLDDALRRFETIDPRAAKVVQLRFFAGLRENAIAELLEVSAGTVRRDWRIAQAWLAGVLDPATDEARARSGHPDNSPPDS